MAMHTEILQREQKSHFYIESIVISGAVGGKTGKTSVLPVFSKIECDGGSALHCYGGLT